MKAIYSLYVDPERVQRAANELRATGISDDRVEILSSEPFEEYEFGKRNHETWMPWIAVLGGAMGFVGIYTVMYYAQRAWPINTGGMPIISHYATMVPLFEITMLGAVLATVATLVVTARLIRGGGLYDPAISDGKILLGVTNPSESEIPLIEAALASGEIKRTP